MKRFVVHCPDDESRDDARKFFTKMFGESIIRNNKYEIETNFGLTVMFTKDALMHTHGCKLEDFLILTNKHKHQDFSTLFCGTLG